MQRQCFKANVDGLVEKLSNGCWEWKYGKTHRYGYVRIGNTSTSAHRVSYEEFIGPIPDGMSVLHKCDNPPCINPEHLYLGTQDDNVRDMIAKGRKRKTYVRTSKKFCNRGHERTPENLYRDWSCKLCKKKAK